MRFARPVLALCLLLVAATLVLGTTSAEAAPTTTPWAKVFPTKGLAGGDTVLAGGAGFRPHQVLSVIQCDTLSVDPSYGCPTARSVTADAKGRVLTTVKLKDPLIERRDFGSGRPVYCRADACRIYFAWTNEYGEQQGVATQALRFTGSPATITVTPSSGLERDAWVKVTGTAYGAEGRTVRIGEHVCFDLIQATDCYGDLPFNWAKVKPDGTFSTVLHVHRFVPAAGYPEGQVDCNGGDELLGSCEVTVTVLNKLGQPDDSFGFSRTFGQPRVGLSFAG